MLEEIIDGVEMDLTISHYETFAALREYCYRVASAVGLVSIEIFGYRNPACQDYAIELGLALQVTNILRDVAERPGERPGLSAARGHGPLCLFPGGSGGADSR